MQKSPLAPPFPQSAVLSAAARAAHLLVDGAPRLFADTLAARLLGPDGDEPLAYHRADPTHPLLRAVRVEATARARFAEHLLARSGVRQYVVLGAGLDTYACRHPDGAVRVLEVDRPDAQAGKRAALARAGLPSVAAFVGVDLAATPLAGALRAGGADPSEPVFVAALGLAPYLTVDELAGLLRAVAGWPGGAHLVADHVRPPRDEASRAYGAAVGASAAAGGEPWRSRPTSAEVAALARAAGFSRVRATGQRAALPAALWRRTDRLAPSATSGLLHAAT